MAKKIIPTTPPNLVGIPRVDFLRDDFDTLVYNKGYDVIIERALPCPCKYRRQEAQSSCKNCMGFGWVFVDPISARAVLQSLNKQTRYLNWTAALMGTVGITIESRFQFGYMDKVIVQNELVTEAENRIIDHRDDDTLYCVTIYPIKEIQSVYLFVSTEEKLQTLKQGEDFDIRDSFIIFKSDRVHDGDSISIRYRHLLQYNIIDIPHDTRSSFYLNENSKEEINKLPLNAVGRKTHYIYDRQNFDDTAIFDNSIITL